MPEETERGGEAESRGGMKGESAERGWIQKAAWGVGWGEGREARRAHGEW